MANKKITELNEATSISNNDWLVMVDVANDETKKIHAGEVGGNIPIQDTAPQSPEENDLWIDTSEPEEMQEAIVNEYSESTNETYSCDYENKYFGGDELYSGTTAGNITLSESAANYSAIEIFYKSSDSVYLNTGKIYSPNGKNVGLYAPYSIGTTCYSKQAQVSISGTALTISNEIETQLWASNEKVKINQPASGSHYFTIEKVIGYK